jgi:large subunit ribosomal protein L9
VTNQDVASAIWAARKVRVDKRKVLLEEPIKTLGTHMVMVEVHPSVDAVEVKVIVVPETA